MKIKELKIGKKVTKEEIEIWEKENNIFLSDDYKDFLANVGTGDVTDFYSDYDVIGYVKKIAEEEYYSIFSFFHLEELMEENKLSGNFDANKSSLLIFAFGGNEIYSICIDKNSTNYGKIYYMLAGYHYDFIYLQNKPQEYENLPCLENNFNAFIENIELVKE
ncbi:MAG: SMI1/KNR4 family protein [Cyanobacteriota bacterium]